MKNVLLLIIVTLFLGSCSSKFSLQKRKYTGGYYFAGSASKKPNVKSQALKQVAYQPKSELVQENVETIIVNAEPSTKNNRTLETLHASNHQKAAVTNKNNTIKLNTVVKQLYSPAKNTSESSYKREQNRRGFFGEVLSYVAYALAGFCILGIVGAFVVVATTGESLYLLVAVVYLLFAVIFVAAAKSLAG